jgi:hypothetical protein
MLEAEQSYPVPVDADDGEHMKKVETKKKLNSFYIILSTLFSPSVAGRQTCQLPVTQSESD